MKILLLGSGALKIGEAGEFDYSGSQAIKALKEEGHQIILINPNIATYQTGDQLAHEVYFLPVTPSFVEEVIRKEKPDAVLAGFGGQTALNCAIELHHQGVFQKYHVKILGTPIESIIITEDRALFAQTLRSIDADTPKSRAATTAKDSLVAAKEIGLPVMIRAGYALGGKGSGIAKTLQDVEEMAGKTLATSPQILIEEWLGGWKEIEYEVVRDAYDNCITVCNMENFDPMGIHTGESIVVAPSQTLTNSEYHLLRSIAIKVIRHLKIVGECNIQFALDPQSEKYRIIEVNARLSRSSALASKATGYPLAFVAAKLSLGHALPDIQNSITKVTTACFEPALDYIVVKIPRWDLRKFRRVSRKIGSEMKSVGEVMAIGRTFEEAFQKALRMLDTGFKGFTGNTVNDIENVEEEIQFPTDFRVLALAKAMAQGMSVEKIHELSQIDLWFLHKLKHIVDTQHIIKEQKQKMTATQWREIKLLGFSDRQIADLWKMQEHEVTILRHKAGVHPAIKQIDTLAAEYPAKTNYLYLTYQSDKDDVTPLYTQPIIVIGGGPYRIGSSVEFDWCCVTAAETLRSLSYATVMVNCNPETVSTDYDICDRLYFEELSLETLSEIYAKEHAQGIIVSMGGQTSNNLALKAHQANMQIIGTRAESIDRAEDRHKFSQLLDNLQVDQPEWKELSDVKDIITFGERVGYPLLIRPSYVLSGAAMSVVQNEKTLRYFLKIATDISPEHPVVVSKFVLGAKEIEIDGVAKQGELVSWVISEHVENAGVHSGDATIVLPPQKLYIQTIQEIQKITKKIVHSLDITGPFNIQFLAKDNRVLVIECNLRASRSFPFVSKVTRVNLIALATKVMLNKPTTESIRGGLELPYVAVKAPQFSFSRLKGADPVLSVEMTSTGEVACLGDDIYEALLKSILATGQRIPKKTVMISIHGDEQRYRFLDTMEMLHALGYTLFATEHTAEFLKVHNVPTKLVAKAHETDKENNVISLIKSRTLEMVINISEEMNAEKFEDEYEIRRLAIDFGIPLLTNLQIAKLFVDSLVAGAQNRLAIKPWSAYRT